MRINDEFRIPNSESMSKPHLIIVKMTVDSSFVIRHWRGIYGSYYS